MTESPTSPRYSSGYSSADTLRSDSSLSSSEFGIQEISSTPLLTNTLARVTPKKIFERQAKFEQRTKEAYLSSLAATLEAKGNTMDIKDSLKALSIDELRSFEQAIHNDFPIRYLTQNPKKASSAFNKATSYLTKFQSVAGNSLPVPILKELINDLARSEFVRDVDSQQLYTTLDDFLLVAKGIQDQRPQIFTIMDREQSEVSRLLEAEGMLSMSPDLATLNSPVLTGIIQVIKDQTVMTSDKCLEEAIEGSTGERTHLGRTAEHLSPRIGPAPWWLQEEQHPAQLITDGDGMVHFDRHPPELEIQITDPNSLDTRTVRMTLPLHGTVSLDEAKQAVTELGRAARHSLPSDQTELAQHLNQAKHDMALAVYDLQSTEKRPRGAFTLEQPEFAALVGHERELDLGVKAGALGHVHRLADGRFSLLPSSIGELVPLPIHQILSNELVEARTVLLAATETPSPPHHPIEVLAPVIVQSTIDIDKIPLSITTERETRNGAPYLNLMVTIGGVERKTSYPLYRDEQRKQASEIDVKTKLEELVCSPLFERDLLLAKSKYLHMLTKNIPNEAESHG